MVDIASKFGSQVIEKAISEITKEQKFTSLPQDGSSPFKQMFDSIGESQDYAKSLGMTADDMGMPSSDISALSAEGISLDPANAPVGIPQPNGTTTVINLLSEVNNGQMNMEKMVNQIMYGGKKFSNQELLAIQAHVFHFAQVTELVVKAADQGVSSLKAIMNTNIQ